MTRIHAVILVSCIALLLAASGTATTQEIAAASTPTETTTTVTPTMTSESSNKAMYYGDMAGDHAVRVASAECVDRTVVLILGSDLPQTVTVTVPTSSISTDTVAGNLVRRPVPPGRTTIRIDSPEPRVTFVTSYPVRNGRYTEIRFDGGGPVLVVGSFTGAGVRDTAIGGALGASSSTLLVIVRRRFGPYRDMERTA